MKNIQQIHENSLRVNKKITESFVRSVINLDGTIKQLPWRKTLNMSYNSVSGQIYKGVNAFILSSYVEDKGSSAFLTRKQAYKLGGNVVGNDSIDLFYTIHTSKQVVVNTLEDQCKNCAFCTDTGFCRRYPENQLQLKENNSLAHEDDFYFEFSGEERPDYKLCDKFKQKEFLEPAYYSIFSIKDTKGIEEANYNRDLPAKYEVVDKLLKILIEKEHLNIAKSNTYPFYNKETKTAYVLVPEVTKSKPIFYAGLIRTLAYAVGDLMGLEAIFKDKKDLEQNSPFSYGAMVVDMATSMFASQLNINYELKNDQKYNLDLIDKLQNDPNFLSMAANNATRIVDVIKSILKENK